MTSGSSRACSIFCLFMCTGSHFAIHFKPSFSSHKTVREVKLPQCIHWIPSNTMADDPVLSVRSSLSIDQEEDDGDFVPLRTKILQAVKSAPDNTIRPARLSQQVGISLTDASAELCGLLQAVGEGSTFRFEKTGGVDSMVFTFPSDFEAKALAAQRAEDWQQTLRGGVQWLVKCLKVITAFGLILSTLIVSMAGMMALLAAFIALSRGGDRRQRHHISRQVYDLFLMVRQLLWCYAMFGPDGGNQDPFFREVAYDSSLMLGICCGNPMSMWFWFRANRLRQRRRRLARGWGRIMSYDYGDSAADLEGVRLIYRDDTLPVPAAMEEHRGLLSLAVEFLFGPEKAPGPSEADRWRLRGAVILQYHQHQQQSLALQDWSPYLDSPPSSLKDTRKILAEGLLVVAHFNGIPASQDESPGDPTQARFTFPELLAESTVSGSHYDDPDTIQKATLEPLSRWEGLFFKSEAANRTTPRSTVPPYLYEETLAFTSLAANEFYRCLLVAVLNALGVLWFAQSLQIGGILEQFLAPSVVHGLQWSLIPVLSFYAKLFFTIPTIRLICILIWNERCRMRNDRRSHLANQLLAGGRTNRPELADTHQELKDPIAKIVQL